MRKITFSTLLLSSIVITACSGGGGGGDNNQSSPARVTKSDTTISNDSNDGNNRSTSVTPSNPSTPSTPVIPIPDKEATTRLTNSDIIINKEAFDKGSLYGVPVTAKNQKIGELSGYNRTYSFNGAFKDTQVKVDEADSMLVDGIRIALNKGFSKFLPPELADVATELVGSPLFNSMKDSKNVKSISIFYAGYETPESSIPKVGSVTYKGNATRYDNIHREVTNIGTSELTANFDTKKIRGELSIQGARRDIHLQETDIKGNSFKGTAVTTGWIREGEYEGKFFGPNAEEVAGKATFSGPGLLPGQRLESLNTSFSEIGRAHV